MNNIFLKYAYNYTKGLYSYKHKKYNKCVLFFSEAIYLIPESHNAHAMRCLCFLKLENYDNAYSDILTAEIYKKDDANILFLKALIEYKTTKLKECLKTLKKSLSLFPDNYLFPYLAGCIKEKTGDLNAALAFFESSYSLDKNEVTAYKLSSLYKDHAPNKALEIIEGAKKTPSLIFLKAQIQIRFNKRLYSILLFDKNYRDAASYKLACFYFSKRDFKAAAEFLTKLVKKFPGNIDLIILFIKCIYMEGKYSFCLEIADLALSICVKLSLDDEYRIKLLTLKIKIMLMLPEIKRSGFEPPLRTAISLKDKLEDKSFYLPMRRAYNKLYKKFGLKKDRLVAKELKNGKLSDFEGFRVKTRGG